MGVGSVLYLFWTPLQSDTVQKSSDVASKVLSDANVKTQAFLVSKQVVVGVLQDEVSVQLLVDVIARLLAQDSSRQAVSIFLKGLFDDEYTREISKHFVLQLVGDEWVHDQLLDILKTLVLDLLKDESTRRAMEQFLLDTSTTTLRDDEIRVIAGQAIRGAALSAVNPFSGSTKKEEPKKEEPKKDDAK